MKIGLSYNIKKEPHPDEPYDAFVEYDSKETISAIARAINSMGHTVIALGEGKSFLWHILSRDLDLVFNIAEGVGNSRGREAQVPAVLEMLGIPFSGSDSQCLAICLDKPLTKKIVSLSGVNTPEWSVISNIQELEDMKWDRLRFPIFVKPAYEGSSKGVSSDSKANTPEEASTVIEKILSTYHEPALVEEFIEGDEVTVGIIGNSPPEILGIMRVLPKNQGSMIYSRENKEDWQTRLEYECPARLGMETTNKIKEASLRTYETLGCRDFARLDFRVDKNGEPYFLEINPLPGLDPINSDLVIMANKVGLSYEELISRILNSTLQRINKATVPK